MQLFWWYGIAGLCILAALLFRKIQQKLYIVLRRWIKYVIYCVLIQRGPWSAINVTVLDALWLLVLISVNALLAVFGLRSSLVQVAVINLAPLYLEGRTNWTADRLGIPLHTYCFAHRWLGRVVIAQAIVHAVTTFAITASKSILYTGVTGAILLIINFLTSFLFIRRRVPLLFRWIHCILALSTLGIITFHIYLIRGSFSSFSSAICLTAGGIYVASWTIKLIQRWCYQYAEVSKCEIFGDTVCLWVRSRHSVRARPGAYFYLSFPDLPWRGGFQSTLAPLAFWNTEARHSTRELSFILYPALSQAVISHLQRNHMIRVTLDGTYGQELSIGDRELAILVADGKGISGLLPFALSALSRRKHDKLDKAGGLKSSLYRDKTRKVDLIWRPDNNNQVEWASSYFQALADMDSSKMDENAHSKSSKVSIRSFCH